MTITIPQGKSLLYYNGTVPASLTPYSHYINQVLEIHEEGAWFKIYNPSFNNFNDFNSMTPSLSYEFYAYTDFVITV